MKDFNYFGIKNDSYLMELFQKAYFSKEIVSVNSYKYGTTITKRVLIGKMGSINVGYFYEDNIFNEIPRVSAITPKIYKNENSN